MDKGGYTMNFRQVHLDFHTSGQIPGIGSRFDREQWKEALLVGHINSITLFSKCHHGYAYHPSEANEMHPGLDFDLLGEQLEVCRELGINAPVYLSAGLDEKEALRHSEWLSVQSLGAGHDFMNPFYHLFCYNTPYLDRLTKQVEEVMQRYNPSGVFLDISDVRMCYCPHCITSMREAGRDPKNSSDVRKHGEEVYANYCRRIEEAVRKYNPDTTIFHNAGHIAVGRRDLVNFNTHLELESLPTGGWGYDHFPMSAAYVRNLGKEYLGMTGKFHKSWGEFGGFKHPNALRYETSLSLAFGAKCSIGDQLHPSGEFNMATYRLIGSAYSEVEAKEDWCAKATAVSDIAILSKEACQGAMGGNNRADIGCARILLEGKYLFDIIDLEGKFEDYKLVILPDHIILDETLKKRLNAYLASGGKILATGESGLNSEKDAFALDFGATFLGENEYKPTFMVPNESFSMVNGVTQYVMYEPAYSIEAKEGAHVIASLTEPYFNRTVAHFCSHQHTPDKPDATHPAAVKKENTVYIGWCVFDDYAKMGSLHLKELIINAIEALIGDKKTITVNNLPDRGIVTLMKQGDRYVNHLLFAHTSIRGEAVEVIEDVIPIYNISIKIELPKKPSRVYLAPQNEDIEFNYVEGELTYNVRILTIHQMIVVE
jgi:hypothetical protein